MFRTFLSFHFIQHNLNLHHSHTSLSLEQRMGSTESKSKSKQDDLIGLRRKIISKRKPCGDDLKVLKGKIRLLKEEINETRRKREKEGEAHEQQVRVFAVKEAEWKRERKRLREEVGKLRKKLEEKEERIRGMEDEVLGRKIDKEWQLLGANVLVEHMREEQARREEAIEKWKRLYLAIKTELDHLIQRTSQGEGLCWEVEDEMVEGLQRELKAKEETIEVLKEQLAAMEKEGVKREREVDILRQSLRIMSSTKRTNHVGKTLSKLAFVK